MIWWGLSNQMLKKYLKDPKLTIKKERRQAI